MKKHLERQLGVQNVDVSLLDGKVDIQPKGDGLIDPAQLLQATFDSGVTVAELDVVARGLVVEDSGAGLALRIAPNRSFPIAATKAASELGALAGSQIRVTVRGELYRKGSGGKKAVYRSVLSLSITDVLKRE